MEGEWEKREADERREGEWGRAERKMGSGEGRRDGGSAEKEGEMVGSGEGRRE